MAVELGDVADDTFVLAATPLRSDRRPVPLTDPIDLAARLPAPDRFALFLDVDGTLIGPTYADRERGVAADRVAFLGRLYNRLGGARAIVSDRSV